VNGHAGDDTAKKVRSHAAIKWLVPALLRGHADAATLRAARLVLGTYDFTQNMDFMGVFYDFRKALHRGLTERGAGLREKLANMPLLPRHELAMGGSGEVRLDAPGLVPLVSVARVARAMVPKKRMLEGKHNKAARVRLEQDAAKAAVLTAAAGGNVAATGSVGADGAEAHAARQQSERCAAMLLHMLGMALNDQFHEQARRALQPHVLGGEGVMGTVGDGEYRLAPVLSPAAMEARRRTVHAGGGGAAPC
jgi:hypothetical protein